MNPVLIAMVCHETNRAYCITQGDMSQPDWTNAPQWQKDSAINGVQALIDDPSLSPEEMHQKWCDEKVRTGWTHGPVKDPEKKQHHCLVPYDQLPKDQQVKDHLFHAVVKILADLPPGYVHV